VVRQCGSVFTSDLSDTPPECRLKSETPSSPRGHRSAG
jgi:hypothetical protein